MSVIITPSNNNNNRYQATNRAPRSEKPINENIDKIINIAESKHLCSGDQHCLKNYLTKARGEPAQRRAKLGSNFQKGLLSVWWNLQRIIHLELLLYVQTLNPSTI